MSEINAIEIIHISVLLKFDSIRFFFPPEHLRLQELCQSVKKQRLKKRSGHSRHEEDFIRKYIGRHSALCLLDQTNTIRVCTQEALIPHTEQTGNLILESHCRWVVALAGFPLSIYQSART